MFVRFFFIIALAVFSTANTVSPIKKIIRLAFGVSKATYLSIEEGRFIKDGHIVARKRYDPHEKVVCSLGGWSGKGYEKKDTEIMLFKNQKQKLAVFGFRGTEPTNIMDWKKNFDMDLAEAIIGQTKFALHKGFRDRYLDISPWFEAEYEAIPQDYTIVITGHSLGGALATISAAYASGNTNRRPDAVITFASPLVGDKKFHDYYGTKVGCDRTLRITAKGDIVTNFPINKFYTHVCDALEVNGKTGSWWDNLNPLKSHSLYSGYDKGLARKYPNVNEINFGCDKLL